MKKLKCFFKSTIMISALLSLFSCSNDDQSITADDDPTDVVDIDAEEVTTKYVTAFQAINADKTATDYVLELDAVEDLMSGELTIEGQGTPLLGWRFFHQGGETVFSAGYSSQDLVSRAFQLNEGSVQEVADFDYAPGSLDNFFEINATTVIGVDLHAAADPTTFEIPEIEFYIIDAESGGLKSEIIKRPIDNLSYADAVANGETAYMPWLTGMVLRDDKLYMSYHKLSIDGFYTTVDPDRVYVSVYSYPDFEFEKIIYDDRTSPAGVNGHSTGIEADENGNIYSYSSASEASSVSGSTKPSGILRINDGETEFDEDYFFDVEKAANGGKLFWMDYIGNGKALGRIVVDDTLGAWSVFSEQGAFFRLVVLDLDAQTVTNVSNVPEHANRYTSTLFVEEGIAYVSCRTGGQISLDFATGAYAGLDDGETFIYSVDPETATGTKGAEVLGISLKGIFKISN